MAIQSGNITFPQSLSIGAPFWWLKIGNWGNVGTGADATSEQYEINGQSAIAGSPAVICVGPQSTVDGCGIRANQIAPQPAGVDASVPFLDLYPRWGSPVYNVPGPFRILVDASTKWGDEYIPYGDITPAPFGRLSANSSWEDPVLELLVFHAPAPNAVPMKRRALRRQGTDAAPGVAAKKLIAVIPVFGRGRKTIAFSATGTLQATVRVGMVTANGVSAGTLPAIETLMAADQAITAAGAVTAARFTTSDTCDFLTLYYTATAGAGTINYTVEAIDDF